MFRLEFHTEAIFQVLKTLWQSAPLWPKVTNTAQGAGEPVVAQEPFLQAWPLLLRCGVKALGSKHCSRTSGGSRIPLPQEMEKGPERPLLSWAGLSMARFGLPCPSLSLLSAHHQQETQLTVCAESHCCPQTFKLRGALGRAHR